MEADMVCQTIVGELEVTVGDEKFTTKEGDVWSCAKGSTREGAKNNGSEIAIMRVTLLQPRTTIVLAVLPTRSPP
jgi:quercetin dioxygenase-like cupin family protein